MIFTARSITIMRDRVDSREDVHKREPPTFLSLRMN